MGLALESLGLVERARELAALEAALAEAVAGRGAVALVYGEAGIGKTSLVRAFADDSPGPGDHHGSAILRKPGVTNRAQAATEAIRLGVAAKL